MDRLNVKILSIKNISLLELRKLFKKILLNSKSLIEEIRLIRELHNSSILKYGITLELILIFFCIADLLHQGNINNYA